MNLTFFALLSLSIPAFAEICHQHTLQDNQAITLSLCMRCTETDSGACIDYAMTRCLLDVTAQKQLPLDCKSLTCPKPTPEGCRSQQASYSPYGGVEGDIIECREDNKMVCTAGQWKKITD